MLKVLLATFFLVINTQARENPFFPSEGEEDLPYTSNESVAAPKLNRASISLPSTARVIKKVTIEYENLDASYESKSIDLENTIDWHLPIFISQSYTNANTQHVKSRNLKSTKKPKSSYKNIAGMKHVKFSVAENSLKVSTSDKLMRHFLLPQPHRIVMDFKRESTTKSYSKKIPNSLFTKIRIGNHKGYYRVVVELDGYYRYNLKKSSKGLFLTLE